MKKMDNIVSGSKFILAIKPVAPEKFSGSLPLSRQKIEKSQKFPGASPPDPPKKRKK